ncbi:MAG: hypothetical protein KKG02_10740 [Candidatus Edwardsbacteria bacterium]|nr:hypothetical protein [Candidatus Edwardsbacteria bacterium]MBU2595001.1 hypothetical protein [Candidatus Edwardsbacteria bacterium]
MNILKNVIVLALVTLNMSGCATVKFYSDQSLKTETGLKFYSAKPYLLVEHKASNDTSARIVYLPDLANPQYAKIISGLGTSDLSITLNNSILTTYGLKTDTKIPETITSATGLLPVVSSFKMLENINGPESKPKLKYMFELYEIIMDTNGTKLVRIQNE